MKKKTRSKPRVRVIKDAHASMYTVELFSRGVWWSAAILCSADSAKGYSSEMRQLLREVRKDKT